MVTATQAGLAAGAALAGYLIYFDQRRQWDPKFRRQLKNDRMAVLKMQELERSLSASQTDAAIKAAMEALGFNDDKVPESDAEKNAYLTRNLQVGEHFLNQGPTHFKLAATCLFRALTVYPDSMKLLMAFQETVPPPVLDLVMQMMEAQNSVSPATSA
ncbi:protein import receptor MAS20 [Chytriomyces cf. hyalinus JEL632]|nr:protein import receptor MAS20 [Chytriomyces cf. hyalinus JEL632]